MKDFPVIDAHVHFIDPGRHEYPWLEDPRLAPIRRAFSPRDLQPLLEASGVDAVILVQTRSSLEETREFLAIAQETPFVAGVVGWVDLTSPAVADQLADLKAGPGGRYLVGIRHQVHDEPDPDWLLRDDVQRGLQTVAEAGLAYDLLLRPRELPAAADVVRRFPQLRFVVDHLAKPPIASGEIDQWARLMAPLAEADNVWCKLSGMVTEADWKNWKPAHLKPYVDRVVDGFGYSRVLFGSDWPVCLLAAAYRQVKEALEEVLGELSEQQRQAVFGGNARQVYRLEFTLPG